MHLSSVICVIDRGLVRLPPLSAIWRLIGAMEMARDNPSRRVMEKCTLIEGGDMLDFTTAKK